MLSDEQLRNLVDFGIHGMDGVARELLARRVAMREMRRPLKDAIAGLVEIGHDGSLAECSECVTVKEARAALAALPPTPETTL